MVIQFIPRAHGDEYARLMPHNQFPMFPLGMVPREPALAGFGRWRIKVQPAADVGGKLG